MGCSAAALVMFALRTRTAAATRARASPAVNRASEHAGGWGETYVQTRDWLGRRRFQEMDFEGRRRPPPERRLHQEHFYTGGSNAQL